MSNSSDTYSNFTTEQVDVLIATRAGATTVGVVACLAAILLVLTTKAYRQYVFRLLLYLSAASFFSSLVDGLELLSMEPGKHAVYQRDGWKDVCATAGFLHLYGIWLILGLSSWIGVYLLLVSFFKGYLLKNAMGEVFGIIVVIFFPLTIIWLPFLHGMYGLTGIWCDIMPSEGGYGVSNSTSGVVYQMTLFYGPSFLAASLGTASVIFMVIAFCRHALNKNQELQRQYRIALKETLPLLIFTVGFEIFATINVVQGVYDALTVAKKNNSPSFGLWIAASLFPCIYCLLPMLIMCQPYIYTHLKCKKCRGISKREQLTNCVTHNASHTEITVPNSSRTEFIVSVETGLTDESPLIVRGKF